MKHDLQKMFSAQTCEWYTPSAIFNEMDKEFHFTLDVCADESNRKCEKYFDINRSGLMQRWAPNVCWMNPPYGGELTKWMTKAYEESQNGATVVCLVPSRTSANWWHDIAMLGEIRFLRKRLKYETRTTGSTNKKQQDAPFASSFVIFRPPKVST